jgi:hypothetical protein
VTIVAKAGDRTYVFTFGAPKRRLQLLSVSIPPNPAPAGTCIYGADVDADARVTVGRRASYRLAMRWRWMRAVGSEFPLVVPGPDSPSVRGDGPVALSACGDGT